MTCIIPYFRVFPRSKPPCPRQGGADCEGLWSGLYNLNYKQGWYVNATCVLYMYIIYIYVVLLTLDTCRFRIGNFRTPMDFWWFRKNRSGEMIQGALRFGNMWSCECVMPWCLTEKLTLIGMSSSCCPVWFVAWFSNGVLLFGATPLSMVKWQACFSHQWQVW